MCGSTCGLRPLRGQIWRVCRLWMGDVRWPWLVGDHYVVSEQWRPYYETGYSLVNTIRVWARLPKLLLEYLDAQILTQIGDKFGKRSSRSNHADNYAQICVEVNLEKPLLSDYRLQRRIWRIQNEGLHVMCFRCGYYGHQARRVQMSLLRERILFQMGYGIDQSDLWLKRSYQARGACFNL